MATLREPGIQHEYITNISSGPVRPGDISTVGIHAVCEWGPVNTPTKIESIDEAIKIFGSYQSNSDFLYFVKSFYDNGGRELWVNRLAHYTDITDKDSQVGNAASSIVKDTLGNNTLTINAKYPGSMGNDIQYSITHAPIHESELSSAASSGDVVLYVTTPNKLKNNMVLKVLNGTEIIDLEGAIESINDLKASYASHVANAVHHVNADTSNDIVAPDATDLSSASLLLDDIIGALNSHALSETGVGDEAHTNADDILSLPAKVPAGRTLPELLTDLRLVLEDFNQHIVRVVDSGDNAVHVSPDVTNTVDSFVVEYVKVDSFESVVLNGNISHAVTIKSPLTNGFATSATTVSSMEFNLDIYLEGENSPRESFESLSIEGDYDNYINIVNSDWIDLVDLSKSIMGVGYDIPMEASRVNLTEGVDVETGLSVVSIIGSENTGTGLYAFDGIEKIRLVACIPGTAVSCYNNAYRHAATLWAKDRLDTFVLFEPDPSLSSDADNILSDIVSSGLDSRFGAMYGPRVKVIDPNPDAAELTRYITPLGAVLGKIVSVDNTFGPWESASGASPYGDIVNVLGLEFEYKKAKRASLNDAGVNLIVNKPNGIRINGARTLSKDEQWKFLSVSRTFAYAQVSIDDSVEVYTFRHNVRDTWIDLKNKLNDFFRGLYDLNALYGNSPDQSFVVKVGEIDGVQTREQTNSGILVVEVGLAVSRPSEFITFRWYQTGQGTSVEVV